MNGRKEMSELEARDKSAMNRANSILMLEKTVGLDVSVTPDFRVIDYIHRRLVVATYGLSTVQLYKFR